MAGKNVIEFTDSNFDQEVLKSSVPVLVDFWAEWCPPCKRLAPTIDKLAADYGGKVKIGKLDTDSNMQTASQYSISSIPTILVFKGGQIARKFVGFKSEQELRSAIDESLLATAK